MVQKVLLSILIYSFCLTAYSQAGSDSIDTVKIRKTVAKSVRYPIPAHREQEAGVALIRIVKKGEKVGVESLYTSDNAFDFALPVNKPSISFDASAG